MKTGIVLLSRNRPTLLGNLLASLQANTKRPEELQVLVRVDDDDENEYDYDVDFDLQFYVGPRPVNMHDTLTYLARNAVADGCHHVLVLNDDCEMNQKEWDVILKEDAEYLDGHLSDGIWLLAPRDNSIDKVSLPFEYASFPCISAKAILSSGIFLDSTFPFHGADVVTARIYNSVGRYVESRLDIRHVFHECPQSLQNRLLDKTASDMIEKTMSQDTPSLGDMLTCDISKPVGNLLEKMTSIQHVV